MRHETVLLKPLVDALNVQPDGVYVDATFGAGGHSLELLSRLGPQGRLFGFDRDLQELKKAQPEPRLILRHNNFADFAKVVRADGVDQVDGVMADLGVSSMQFDQAERGFSYRMSAKLDMRMNAKSNLDAAMVLNTYSLEQLWYMLSDYGEVKNAKTLAQEIVKYRSMKPIEWTEELMQICESCFYGNKFRYLSQVFQAIRMEVNDELGQLERFLTSIAKIVKVGGRVGIITFHSLEDRMVKRFFKSGNLDGQVQKNEFGQVVKPFALVNKKPIQPSAEEIKQNIRARSAKLRIVERIKEKYE